MSEIPALPYAGTSGFAAGSPTSQQRQIREDEEGVTESRQTTVIAYLQGRGGLGVTSPELEQRYGWHHGQASAALSNLHKAGKIARLAQSRERCSIYVLPDHVNGREVQQHGSEVRAQAVATSVLHDIEAVCQEYRAFRIGPSAAMQRIEDLLGGR